MVYVIAEQPLARGRASENAVLVKIGFTTAATCAPRMGSLQTGNPRRLKIVAQLEGDARAERRVHKHFAAYREVGEWFLLPPWPLRVAGWKRIRTVDDWVSETHGFAWRLAVDDFVDIVPPGRVAELEEERAALREENARLTRALKRREEAGPGTLYLIEGRA